MLENAARICEAKFGTLFFCEGDALRFAGACMVRRRAFAEVRRREPFRPGPRPRSRRVAETKRVSHIADVEAEPSLPTRSVAGRWSNSPARARDRRSDAQGKRVDRRHRDLPPGSAARSPTSRSSWSRISPPGRHRYREHPPAQRAARDRCSSRPRPPMCSRSSAARPSICRPCSTRLVESAARLCQADMAAIPARRRGLSSTSRAMGSPSERMEYMKEHRACGRTGIDRRTSRA